MAGETLEKTVYQVSLDESAVLASYQALSQAHRQWLQTLGDSPQVAEQLRALDEFDARLSAASSRLQETGDAGRQAAEGIEAAGQAGDRSHRPIDNTRAAVSHLGAQLANLIGVAPQAGSALMQLTAGAITPQVGAFMLLSAAVGAVSQALSAARSEAAQLRQQMIDNTMEVRNLLQAMEDYYQKLDARRGKTFLTREQVELQGRIQSGALITGEQAGHIVALAMDQGLSDEQALQFAHAFRTQPRRYPLTRSGVRRFIRESSQGVVFPEPTETERSSDTGQMLTYEGEGTRAAARHTVDPETRFRLAARALGMSEAQVEEAITISAYPWYLPDPVNRARQMAWRSSDEVQRALEISRTQFNPNGGVGGSPVIINNNAFVVNQSTQSGRTPDMGSKPRY